MKRFHSNRLFVRLYSVIKKKRSRTKTLEISHTAFEAFSQRSAYVTSNQFEEKQI